MDLVKTNKRKNDDSKFNDEMLEPSVKVSKKNSDIRSLKKGDIILKYAELKRKFAILHEENLKLKNENHQNLVAMNNLEEKAELLEERLQTLLKAKTSSDGTNDTNALENNEEDLKCDNCGYPAQDLCDLGAHIFEWHAEEKWEEVFLCAFCDMRYPTKNDLMTHRKNKHIEKVPICRYYED